MDAEQNNISLFDLTIDQSTTGQFNQIGKWSRFVAVAIWSMLGVIILFVTIFNAKIIELIKWYYATKVFGSDIYSSKIDSPGFKIGMSIMLLAVIVILGVYYMFLYLFGNNLLKAAKKQDQQALERSFHWYKIFTIIATIFGCISALFVIYSFLTRIK